MHDSKGNLLHPKPGEAVIITVTWLLFMGYVASLEEVKSSMRKADSAPNLQGLEV